MDATPIIPTWFKGRQCKAEPAGNDHTRKVTGPNLGEAYLFIAPAEGGRWRAGLRMQADGPDVALTEHTYDNPKIAWDVAFELYRTHVIV
jgi:hypothetical protein